MEVLRKTITISTAMETWVKAQIASGRYANDSEYFRDLIRHDQDRRQAKQQLLALIEEALNSGVSKNSITDIMGRVEERLKQDGTLPANG